MINVFIDGQAGTTGLEISERLSGRSDLRLLEVDAADRKSDHARKALMSAADITILCLPDEAAREAVNLSAGQTRFLDASSAHRTHSDWIYGLPELRSEQRQLIANAAKVSNPGCYPQGPILCLRPLIDHQLLDPAMHISIHAVSGYSGGGRPLIERYQNYSAEQREQFAIRNYALQLRHKHIPELQRFSQLRVKPLFTPMVGGYYQGMLTELPLALDQLRPGTTRADVHNVLCSRYAQEPFIRVLPLDAPEALIDGYLDATACNQTNRLEIMVFGNEQQLLLVARYDNLGKGAAGTAVQNLNLMLGQDETKGLSI